MVTSQDYKLLVLDLDETLVFSTEQELHRPADLRVAGYHVYKRPYLDAFLDYAFANFHPRGWPNMMIGAATKTALAQAKRWVPDHEVG